MHLCISDSEYSRFLYWYSYLLMWRRNIVKPATIIGLARAANLHQALFGSKDICIGLICNASRHNANLSKKPFGSIANERLFCTAATLLCHNSQQNDDGGST